MNELLNRRSRVRVYESDAESRACKHAPYACHDYTRIQVQGLCSSPFPKPRRLRLWKGCNKNNPFPFRPL